MNIKYLEKNKILFILFLFTAINCYSYELNNDEYINKFSIDKENINIEIYEKNGKEFQYYNIYGTNGPAYVGFKFSNNKKININGLNIGLFSTTGKENIRQLSNNLFKVLSKDNELISPSLMSQDYSTSYRLPLESKLITKTKHLKLNFNYKNFINSFNIITKFNKIKGNQKIKFYVILIQSSQLDYIYFESPEFIYNFK